MNGEPILEVGLAEVDYTDGTEPRGRIHVSFFVIYGWHFLQSTICFTSSFFTYPKTLSFRCTYISLISQIAKVYPRKLKTCMGTSPKIQNSPKTSVMKDASLRVHIF